MFLGTELPSVREVHRAELGEGELLEVARKLDAFFRSVYVTGHLNIYEKIVWEIITNNNIKVW